jgi:molybdopterin synthase sulfur carrier subunit
VIHVAVRIPAALAPLAGGRTRLDLEVAEAPAGAVSLGRVLEVLWAACPGVRDRVVTEQGEVRPHVNVFVGAECIRWTGGLTTPVVDGTEVSILPAVSGGAHDGAARAGDTSLPGRSPGNTTPGM